MIDGHDLVGMLSQADVSPNSQTKLLAKSCVPFPDNRVRERTAAVAGRGEGLMTHGSVVIVGGASGLGVSVTAAVGSYGFQPVVVDTAGAPEQIPQVYADFSDPIEFRKQVAGAAGCFNGWFSALVSKTRR